MDIVRIRRNFCKCGSRVLICAEEVAHIGEEAEVFVVDRCVELLDTLGILHIESVVFDHGADAELCSVPVISCSRPFVRRGSIVSNGQKSPELRA